MEGKYQTEDGRPVEILRTGLYYDGPFNVLGIIWQGDGKCVYQLHWQRRVFDMICEVTA